MNADRRKQLKFVRAKLAEACILIEAARDSLESAKDEELEAFENMPESLQNGDKGTAMNEGIDTMGELWDTLDDMATELGNADDAITNDLCIKG
jgi:hypothetical protein